MRTELISEVMDEGRLGLKVRLEGHAPRTALRRIGETWARSAQGRAGHVHQREDPFDAVIAN